MLSFPHLAPVLCLSQHAKFVCSDRPAKVCNFRRCRDFVWKQGSLQKPKNQKNPLSPRQARGNPNFARFPRCRADDYLETADDAILFERNFDTRWRYVAPAKNIAAANSTCAVFPSNQNVVGISEAFKNDELAHRLQDDYGFTVMDPCMHPLRLRSLHLPYDPKNCSGPLVQ